MRASSPDDSVCARRQVCMRIRPASLTAAAPPSSCQVTHSDRPTAAKASASSRHPMMPSLAANGRPNAARSAVGNGSDMEEGIMATRPDSRTAGQMPDDGKAHPVGRGRPGAAPCWRGLGRRGGAHGPRREAVKISIALGLACAKPFFDGPVRPGPPAPYCTSGVSAPSKSTPCRSAPPASKRRYCDKAVAKLCCRSTSATRSRTAW